MAHTGVSSIACHGRAAPPASPSNDIGSARRGPEALNFFNFFMADMQAGIGPFLGVFLQQRGWSAGPIGTVMTAGGVAGMIMTAPAGAFNRSHDEKAACRDRHRHLYGLAVVGAGKGNAALFTAETVAVAQAVMIFASLAAMRLSAGRGYWLVLLISFAALPLRGFLAGSFIEHRGVWPVQMPDGIGAGLQSVAVPGLVARLLDGSGRVNVGQGTVMTVQGLGASLSPAIGGWLAQLLDLGVYKAAFPAANRPEAEVLAGYRCISLDIVPACAGGPDFRLTRHHHKRLTQELARAEAEGQTPLVFMHIYPGDLAAGGDKIARVFADARIAFVDTGHTHHSELLNDGRVNLWRHPVSRADRGRRRRPWLSRRDRP